MTLLIALTTVAAIVFRLQASLRTVPQELSFDAAEGTSPDHDGDGLVSLLDNCPLISNREQSDSDDNGVGDACENLDERAEQY